MTKEVKKNKYTVKQEEIDKLQAMLDHDEEEEIEKDMKELLKKRRQKIHRQVADMESHNKRLLMWSLIIVIMVVIIGFWLFKFNEIISRPLAVANYEIKQIDFGQAKEELTATMQRVKTGIEEIKVEAEKFEQERQEKTTVEELSE